MPTKAHVTKKSELTRDVVDKGQPDGREDRTKCGQCDDLGYNLERVDERYG